MNIRDYLAGGKPLLFDGAMGTWYAAQPGRAEARCETANLRAPQEIAAIHQAYLEAGCKAIRTNTFDLSGNWETAEEIIRAGCAIARPAAEPFGAFVFADLGPAPQNGPLSPAAHYRRQAEVFLAQGLTCFIAETLPSAEGIPELAQYLKERCPQSFLLVGPRRGHPGGPVRPRPL